MKHKHDLKCNVKEEWAVQNVSSMHIAAHPDFAMKNLCFTSWLDIQNMRAFWVVFGEKYQENGVHRKLNFYQK